MTGAALLARAGVWLAQVPAPPGAPPVPGTERGEEFGKTSPIALVVILLLGLATALLIRSMNKRLRNVPASFGPEDDDVAAPQDVPADGPPAPSATRTGVTERTEGPPPTGSP
jgi:hypothetical protein